MDMAAEEEEEEASRSSSESSGVTFDALIDIDRSASASFERERLLRTKSSSRSAALDTCRVLLPQTMIPSDVRA
jgi:hypothetical protein